MISPHYKQPPAWGDISIFPGDSGWHNSDRPLWLEIGPGKGDFLLQMAEKNPHITIAAIEIRHMRFCKLVQRVIERNLKNVVLLHGRAQHILPTLFAANSLERIYILFPDPWPKRRQQHKRLWNPDFFKLCHQLLKEHGSLFLASDDQAYVRHATDVLEKRQGDFWLRQSDKNFFETHYARKWKKMGRDLSYREYLKSYSDSTALSPAFAFCSDLSASFNGGGVER